MEFIRLARAGRPTSTIARELAVRHETVVRVLESLRGYLHDSPLRPQHKGADERQVHLARRTSGKGGPR